MILSLAQSSLPEGWALTHIIALGEEWQVNIKSDEHVVVATGETIEDALSEASAKAEAGLYSGRLFHLAPLRAAEVVATGKSLLAQLGLAKPKLGIVRRF